MQPAWYLGEYHALFHPIHSWDFGKKRINTMVTDIDEIDYQQQSQQPYWKGSREGSVCVRSSQHIKDLLTLVSFFIWSRVLHFRYSPATCSLPCLREGLTSEPLISYGCQRFNQEWCIFQLEVWLAPLQDMKHSSILTSAVPYKLHIPVSQQTGSPKCQLWDFRNLFQWVMSK